MQAAETVEKAIAWQGFVDRYEAAAIATRDAGRVLDQLQGRLIALTQEAARAGFSPYNGDAYLSVFPSPHVQCPLDSMVEIVGHLRRMIPFQEARRLYVVRFLEWTMCDPGTGYTTAYMTGQEAGFSAEIGWDLVTKQRAVWADPLRIPPRPVKSRRHPKPGRTPGPQQQS